jgi:hypothetical protein
MWTLENRALYDRSKLRYPSDLTDEEWAIIDPLIPPAKLGGNKRTVDVRAVVNGVMYVGQAVVLADGGEAFGERGAADDRGEAGEMLGRRLGRRRQRDAAWFKTYHFQVTPEIDRALMVKGFLVLGVTLI